jgi:hypothetical protein
VREDLEACRAALGRPTYAGNLASGQGALAVLTDVDEARVTVDGIDRGSVPLAPFALNAGRHTLTLSPVPVGGANEAFPFVRVPVPIVVDVVPGIVVDALLLTGKALGR